MSVVELFGCEIYPVVCAISISESLLCCCQLWGNNLFCGYIAL